MLFEVYMAELKYTLNSSPSAIVDPKQSQANAFIHNLYT